MVILTNNGALYNNFNDGQVTVTWDIPENTPSGFYRITHQGFYKTLVKVIYV
jgi:hypothetical protein